MTPNLGTADRRPRVAAPSYTNGYFNQQTYFSDHVCIFYTSFYSGISLLVIYFSKINYLKHKILRNNVPLLGLINTNIHTGAMAFVRRLGSLPTFRSSPFAGRHFSTETNGSTPDDAPKSSETTEIPKQVDEADETEKSKKPTRFGFKDSFLKFSNIFEEKPEQPPQLEQSFASLLRKSKLMEVVSFFKNSLFPLD